MEGNNKLIALKEYLLEKKSIAVAFSGGVDSTFLLKVAYEVLGKNALAVTVVSEFFTKREYKESRDFMQSNGIASEIIQLSILENQIVSQNPVDRCYFCKKDIFEQVIEAAKKRGIQYVADGSNVDDDSDYRPGKRALKELNVVSPLKEVGMTKEDIRVLSKQMNLPTYNKPAFACLASRIPYGEAITKENLEMIELGEDFLLENGFSQFRVRHHNNLARIEILKEDILKFFDDSFREIVYNKFKEIGYTYVTLDIRGYRTGSLNETISILK